MRIGSLSPLQKAGVLAVRWCSWQDGCWDGIALVSECMGESRTAVTFMSSSSKSVSLSAVQHSILTLFRSSGMGNRLCETNPKLASTNEYLGPYKASSSTYLTPRIGPHRCGDMFSATSANLGCDWGDSAFHLTTSALQCDVTKHNLDLAATCRISRESYLSWSAS